MDRKRLFDEHRSLAGKLVEGGLTPNEAQRLSMVRAEIDKLQVEEIRQGQGSLGKELRKNPRVKL